MPHNVDPAKFASVCAFAMQQEHVTAATIQRQFLVGHDVALRYAHHLERIGIIGSPDHEGKRVHAGVRRLLFLDFDGVLHTSSGPLFGLAGLVAAALGEHPCSIVVSSSWRFGRSVSMLSQLLPPPLSNRIVAATGSAVCDRYARYKEIEYFLQAEPESPNWVAIDDSGGEFPTRERVLICNPSQGFGECEERAVRGWLSEDEAA